MGRAILSDPAKQEALFAVIRSGAGRYEAAQAVGVAPLTYQKFYRANPEFAASVEEAINASVEPVIKMLRDEALAGDIAAAKEYLRHSAPPPKSETRRHEVAVSHGADPATLASIADIRARLEGRRPELEVIDVAESDEADEDG